MYLFSPSVSEEKACTGMDWNLITVNNAADPKIIFIYTYAVVITSAPWTTYHMNKKMQDS